MDDIKKSTNKKNNHYVRFSGMNPFGSQAKLILHYDRLSDYLESGDTKPIFMEVGLTNKCNMSCIWCITENGRDNKNGEEINLDVLKKYLFEFKAFGGKAITFCGQGEPTYYPYFKEATLYAREIGLELGLMTNGIYPLSLNEIIGNNFKWVRFSLDTLDETKYKSWKGVNGVKTVKRNSLDLGKYPIKVGINCNVGMEYTVEEAKNLMKWCIENDEITYLQFRPILPRYYKNESPELNAEVWDYLHKNNNEKINLSDDKMYDILSENSFSFRSCEGHFFEPIIDASGNVKVCTYHPDKKELSFGNVYESSFQEIWSSEKRKNAIDFVRKMNYKNECQVCCKCAELNKLIDFIKHPEESQDINFL